MPTKKRTIKNPPPLGPVHIPDEMKQRVQHDYDFLLKSGHVVQLSIHPEEGDQVETDVAYWRFESKAGRVRVVYKDAVATYTFQERKLLSGEDFTKILEQRKRELAGSKLATATNG